jgi:ferredoxin
MASVVRIRILPHGAEVLGSGASRLVDLIDDREGVGLPLSCRGGNCAVCRVHVTRGTDLLEPASPRELETLHFARAAADERLGCQLCLRSDARGEVELVLSSTSASAGS